MVTSAAIWKFPTAADVLIIVATTLALGLPLPPFTLRAQDGSERSLPDHTGPNLVVFYRGDW